VTTFVKQESLKDLNSLKEDVIARKQTRTRSPRSSHRINRNIRFPQIRVIAPDGDQLGVMSPEEGLEHAEQRGLDLVEVAADARPPVCRIMDYGKFRYDQSKKEAASRSSRVQMKTIQLRPNTDDHDMETKLKRAEKFVSQGNPVKFVMRMRGRERAYTDRWIDQLAQILRDFAEACEQEVNIVDRPRGEGWRIHAIVEPC
jgi:translation initiation factor IF-3